MDEQGEIKAAVVKLCIADALKAENPYRSINNALAMLKRKGWSEADRVEVQMQVLEELRRRRQAGA